MPDEVNENIQIYNTPLNFFFEDFTDNKRIKIDIKNDIAIGYEISEKFLIEYMSFYSKNGFKGSLKFRNEIHPDEFTYFYPDKNEYKINNLNTLIFDLDIYDTEGLIKNNIEMILLFNKDFYLNNNLKLFKLDNTFDLNMNFIPINTVYQDANNLMIKYNMEDITGKSMALIIEKKNSKSNIINWSMKNSNNSNIIYDPFDLTFDNMKSLPLFKDISNYNGNYLQSQCYYQINFNSSSRYLETNLIYVKPDTKYILTIGGFSCNYTKTDVILRYEDKNLNAMIPFNPQTLTTKTKQKYEKIPELKQGKGGQNNNEAVYISFTTPPNIEKIDVILWLSFINNASITKERLRIYLNKFNLIKNENLDSIKYLNENIPITNLNNNIEFIDWKQVNKKDIVDENKNKNININNTDNINYNISEFKWLDEL